MTAGTWWGDANVTALPYGAHDNSSRIRDHLLASSPVADWAAIEREVIDGYFRFSPNHARAAGDHSPDPPQSSVGVGSDRAEAPSGKFIPCFLASGRAR